MLLGNRKCLLSLVRRAILSSETPVCRTAIALQQTPLLQQRQGFTAGSLNQRKLQLISVNPKHLNLSWQLSNYCTEAKKPSPQDTKTGDVTPEEKKGENPADPGPEGNEEQLTVFQRFKIAYKEHGKILVAVHVATSIVWYSSFVYAAKIGVDVVPLMEWIGLSDKIINPFKNSGAGDFAIAYLMYKLATPARYTVTLGGTNVAIKYLRQTGKMEQKQESFRELVKDSREEMKERTDKLKDDLKTRRSEMKNKSISNVKKDSSEDR